MNEFNEKFGKNYHVGPAGLAINGIQKNYDINTRNAKKYYERF